MGNSVGKYYSGFYTVVLQYHYYYYEGSRQRDVRFEDSEPTIMLTIAMHRHLKPIIYEGLGLRV